MMKRFFLIALSTIMIVFNSAYCFAYTRSYSEYRAAKEREYQRYQSEKERSYQNNRNKSYAERRQDYENIYQKHAQNNEKIYNQYHGISSGTSNVSDYSYSTVTVPQTSAQTVTEAAVPIGVSVTDITQSWIYGTWVQQENPNVTLTIGSFSSTTFGGITYATGNTVDYGMLVLCTSYNISAAPSGLSSIATQFVKLTDNTAQVTIATAFTDMSGNTIPLGTCVLNMVKI